MEMTRPVHCTGAHSTLGCMWNWDHSILYSLPLLQQYWRKSVFTTFKQAQPLFLFGRAQQLWVFPFFLFLKGKLFGQLIVLSTIDTLEFNHPTSRQLPWEQKTGVHLASLVWETGHQWTSEWTTLKQEKMGLLEWHHSPTQPSVMATGPRWKAEKLILFCLPLLALQTRCLSLSLHQRRQQSPKADLKKAVLCHQLARWIMNTWSWDLPKTHPELQGCPTGTEPGGVERQPETQTRKAHNYSCTNSNVNCRAATQEPSPQLTAPSLCCTCRIQVQTSGHLCPTLAPIPPGHWSLETPVLFRPLGPSVWASSVSITWEFVRKYKFSGPTADVLNQKLASGQAWKDSGTHHLQKEAGIWSESLLLRTWAYIGAPVLFTALLFLSTLCCWNHRPHISLLILFCCPPHVCVLCTQSSPGPST